MTTKEFIKKMRMYKVSISKFRMFTRLADVGAGECINYRAWKCWATHYGKKVQLGQQIAFIDINDAPKDDFMFDCVREGIITYFMRLPRK